MKTMSVKKWIAMALKVGLAIIILVLEASESMNFFSFIFPPEQWFLAYTGLALTSGAMLVYMYLFIFDTVTTLQRTVALVMALLSLGGAVLTAGFGMQVESWARTGYELAQSDIDFMILTIRILLIVHGIALLLYFAGDKVISAFGDEDGDGVPNYRDPDFKRNKHQQQNQRNNQNQPQQVNQNALILEIAKLKAENERLQADGNKSPNQHGQGNQN
jgi:hypothetical protein